jgi:hypothetical protein
MAETEEPTKPAYALARRDGGSVALIPTNLEDAIKIAQRLANSGLVPASMRGNPDAVFAGMMLANELGVSTMQGLSNIAVVNGRASVWGELATAIVRASGLCEYLSPPKFTGTGPTMKCTVVGKRKGEKDEVSMEYSMEDAKLAGHLSKDTYQKNPKDMIMWKALHRLYKFLWADVLKGLTFREFAGEVPEAEVEEVKVGEIPGDENPKTALSAQIPGPKAAAPALEATADELRAKAEAAKLKKQKLEEEEAAQKKAAIPEAEVEIDGKPAEELKGDAAKPDAGAKLPDGEVRHIGTVVRCPYKPNADKSGYDYFVVLATAEGEVRLQCSTKEAATALSALKGKTATVFANAKGIVVRY